MMKRPPNLVGVTGEHYVAAFLSGRSLIVALPRGGNPGTDLFVAEPAGGPSLRIQVKTGKDAQSTSKKEGVTYYSWDTSYSVVNGCDPSLWFAYVWLNGWPGDEKLPEVFFVPSKIIADFMKANHTAASKRPFFWMNSTEALHYKGDKGLEEMRKAMAPSPCGPAQS